MAGSFLRMQNACLPKLPRAEDVVQKAHPRQVGEAEWNSSGKASETQKTKEFKPRSLVV